MHGRIKTECAVDVGKCPGSEFGERRVTTKAEAALLRLRNTVQPPQRDLLTALWVYHVAEGLWMPAREFHHHARGVTAAKQALDPLGGAVVWRSEEPDDRYHLTPLGVLLTRWGPELEGLLVQWLLYLKDRYWKEPTFSQVRLEEAREPLKLTGDQDAQLGRLVALDAGILWGGSGSGQAPWSFGPPSKIDELAEKSTTELVEYLLDQVLTDYLKFGNELPIAGRERSALLMRSSFTFMSGANGRPAMPIVDDSEAPRQKRHTVRKPSPRATSKPLTATAPPIEFAFIVDPDLRATIEQDYGEARRAFEQELHKAAALLLGSVAEGLLLDLLQRPSAVGLASYEQTASEILPKMKGGSGINWGAASLDQLTRTAETLGLIHTTRAHLLRGMRDFRNTVHPQSELREKNRPSGSDTRVLVAAVGSLIEQIRQVQ